MRRIPTLVTAPLLLLSLSAQEASKPKFTAANFLPPEHTNLVKVDLALLRQTGIWDDLSASILSSVFRSMEKELGFPLDHLDRVTAVARFDAEAMRGGMVAVEPEQVFVFEGNQPVPLSRADGHRGTVETIGGVQVRVRDGSRPELFLNPVPEMKVWGSRTLIEPVLNGQPWNGQPAADLLSLLSGRGDNLACFVLDVRNEFLRDRMLGRLLGEVAWPEDDRPAFLMLRLRATGGKDDPHLQVDAAIRHLKAGDGAARTHAAAAAWQQKMAGDPWFVSVKATMAKVEWKRQGGDVTASLDLGRSRDAVAVLTRLVLPILKPDSVQTDTKVEVAPAAEAPKAGGKRP